MLAGGADTAAICLEGLVAVRAAPAVLRSDNQPLLHAHGPDRRLQDRRHAPPSSASLDGHVWQSHDGHHGNPTPEKAQRGAASAGTGRDGVARRRRLALRVKAH